MGSNDDLDELDALFDEDDIGFSLDLEQETVSGNGEQLSSCAKENSAQDERNEVKDLEAEYEKLQKQMQELQEKLTKEKTLKLTEKCLDDNNLNNKSNGEVKRSFCAAFGSALGSVESNTSSNSSSSVKDGTFNSSPTSSSHHPKSSTNGCAQPPQKKKRIGHESKHENISTQREVLKPKTFFSQRPNNPPVLKSKSTFNNAGFEIEKYSRIRLKQRHVSSPEMDERMTGKTHLKLSLIRPTMKLNENTDWVTIAVVAKQLDPQTAKNGKKFSIWHLTDLDDCTKHVAFFLFGKVHEQLWRNITVGTVVGLLNPSIMPPKKEDGKYDNTPALTVDVPDRVMKIGVSADLGWCTATKFRNKQPAGKCLAFINKQFGDVCVFHMQSKYKKMSAKRGELQGSVSGPAASKYKSTLWNKVKGDQFFYGGQTFSAAPPSCNPNIQRKESKMKLTNILGKLDTSNQQAQEQVERSKSMQAISGIKEEQVVSGCSDAFAEMLASGDLAAGSRQFLNHLQRKQHNSVEEKKAKTSFSAGDFLKQRRRSNEEKDSKQVKEQPRKPEKQQPACQTARRSNSVNSVSVEDLKKSSQKLLEMKRRRFLERKQKSDTAAVNATPSQSLLKSKTPTLASDANRQGSVDLFGDWLTNRKQSSVKTSVIPSLAQLRKRKAIAKLKGESGKVELEKSDPNSTGIGRIKKIRNNQKLQEKILEKVKGNRKDFSTESKENLPENPNDRSILGGSSMSEEEFNRILSATSSHSNELEVEELERQEKYFNPLIKKEMLEQKMAETFEVAAKVVTCQQCSYTFWAPHERCKQLQHALTWRNTKRRFFECSNCKQRTSTWEPYPTKPCSDCGNEKKWKRTSMLRSKDNVKLDSELLLTRGAEHSRFLSSMK
ncbi:unnamed protein product [Clavelina lepadiformis]|uniref:Protein MCM10 homolog n=1 Tax=Clavelina lepadiformis TaxID=159417 RepID=A0ABP0G9I6_CLALP